MTKATVRDVFIQPLIDRGMHRGRMKASDFAGMLERLAAKLAYMAPDNLAGLRDLVNRMAEGKDGAAWPAEASVLKWAWTLQPPPPRESDYALSLIRSAMGRRAWDEGWAVELFQTARRLGPPPNRYAESQLRADADENCRRRIRVREWIEAGRATPDERAWLSRWHADRAEIAAILGADQGEDAA
ncbi:hypothetical protein [Haematobacter massiliensis]|uniref:hypothetical protein n=1 Tax=Haematobacter massiliensis TaxID=195105 RepID=UPI0023F0F612|nr:hypothetical protein [Haematobacter massiliensis]